jgi:hypothetical protein
MKRPRLCAVVVARHHKRRRTQTRVNVRHPPYSCDDIDSPSFVAVIRPVDAHRYLARFGIGPRTGLVTLMYKCDPDRSWAELGRGWVTLAHDGQFTVRCQRNPLRVLLQQDLRESARNCLDRMARSHIQFQLDTLLLMCFAMGSSRHNSEDRCYGLFFDKPAALTRLAAQLRTGTRVTLLEHGTQAHEDHLCLRDRVRVTIDDSEVCTGLACIDQRTRDIVIYLEYDGQPAHFERWRHRQDADSDFYAVALRQD